MPFILRSISGLPESEGLFRSHNVFGIIKREGGHEEEEKRVHTWPQKSLVAQEERYNITILTYFSFHLPFYLCDG